MVSFFMYTNWLVFPKRENCLNDINDTICLKNENDHCEAWLKMSGFLKIGLDRSVQDALMTKIGHRWFEIAVID